MSTLEDELNNFIKYNAFREEQESYLIDLIQRIAVESFLDGQRSMIPKH